ncbi:hypothetical protein LSH36_1274g00030 [Paralvinella palmiformis]|uniref:Uncharacterized protein n=1 Tax=Paralvinella palmiformis TaxID=53620 RepID=A0AAD9IU15_9ANNE|nr:hypothetical protein LSH36_1274g00030 [Paralvinella palmiformis]
MVSFKLNLKKTMFRKCNDYFNVDKGNSVIAHTRVRLGLNPLNQQMYTLRIVPSPICHRCNTNEEKSPSHHFLRCHSHSVTKITLLQKLKLTMDLLSIYPSNMFLLTNLLIQGYPNLTFVQNVQLFHIIEEFTTNSVRF